MNKMESLLSTDLSTRIDEQTEKKKRSRLILIRSTLHTSEK